MTDKRYLNWDEFHSLTKSMGKCMVEQYGSRLRIYPVPRGGIHVAQALLQTQSLFSIVNNLDEADVIVDDIIDSGRTLARYKMHRPQPFYALINKSADPSDKTWYVFPWEDFPDEPKGESNGPKDAVIRLLEFIGEDPHREGLLKTPDRVIKSYSELFGGYKVDPASLMTTFEDGACDELVLLKNVEFVSFCEHHMLPFVGQAHIAYIPNGKVIGVSKLARLLDVYAQRLQIQERLSQQVTAALMKHLDPLGAACVIESRHLCMVCRGVRKQHSTMITSSLEGVFRTDPAARAELYSMLRQ